MRAASFLSGTDCTDLPPYRRAVHTVFQNYALFPHLDVAGNVAFPLAVAGVPRSERETAGRHRPGLGEAASSTRGGGSIRFPAANGSGSPWPGRIVDSPECVLLDEPLSALDPHLRAETLELLQGIQSRLERRSCSSRTTAKRRCAWAIASACSITGGSSRSARRKRSIDSRRRRLWRRFWARSTGCAAS